MVWRQRNSVVKTSFSKIIFSPQEGPVYFSGKIMSKSCKKGIKSSRKPRFRKISCKRKLHEQLFEIEISDVFENIEKWVLRRPERSLFESKKLCYESWIQSWNYVLQIWVFRSKEWLVSFHDTKHMEFSLFWKKAVFFVVAESFVSTRRFSISSK